MSEFHSLATLIKRLEVATTRLEDLALSGMSASNITATNPPAAPAASSAQPKEAPVELPRAVEAFNSAMDTPVKKFIELSEQLGGPVQEQAQLLQELINAQRDFIHIAAIAKKPDMSSPTFAKLVEPIQKPLMAITEVKDKNRGHKQFNHLSTVAEGVPAFGWIAVEPTPAPYVQEMGNAAQFYSNRVVKEFKDKDPQQIEWTKAFLAILNELYSYVKEHHRTGLVWNPNGENPDSAFSKVSSQPSGSDVPTPTATAPPPAPAPSAGGPPPPPPPPPPVMTEFEDAAAKPAPATTGASAVFAELNKGESVTSGLRKVDKSQMTHKNPSLRAGSVVSEDAVKKTRPPTPNKPGKYVLKKPAKTELQGNKWVVENHEGNSEVVIEGEINHAVYIFGCKNSTIRIKGKVNAVTMDSCNKCGLGVDTIVSTVDLVNCRSFGVQIFNVTPTIVIDKCDGGQVYLSKNCLDVEILTAKTSAVNILVPESPAEDAEFVELPVPEQLKSTIVDGKVVTVAVEHAG